MTNDDVIITTILHMLNEKVQNCFPLQHVIQVNSSVLLRQECKEVNFCYCIFELVPKESYNVLSNLNQVHLLWHNTKIIQVHNSLH